jgi:predicted hotdog family 3-hydroxylacyl-ACP dehydratase
MTFGTMSHQAGTLDVVALIPQKPPFVLVDTLLVATPALFRSAFTVPGDHVLLRADRLSEAGLMENAAQTAALGMGKLASDQGAPPPLGFIGALSRVEVMALPRIGDRLETTVDLRHEVMSARVLEAKVECNGALIAKLELKVFLMDQMP